MRSLFHRNLWLPLASLLVSLIALSFALWTTWWIRFMTPPWSLPAVISYDQAYCIMDTTAQEVQGYWVVASTTTAGRCEVLVSGPYYHGWHAVGVMLDNTVTQGQLARVLRIKTTP